MTAHAELFRFDNSYARELAGLYLPWKPAPAPSPALLYLNQALAAELGLDTEALAGATGAAVFSGNLVPPGAEPLAQAYAGHQFGGFSPQLGDGRALLLGEVIDRAGRRRDIAFKGSGRTPFSRGGDGKAAVGPMLREVLIGEAMHALGIPTTRALAVAATGDEVMREQVLPGAVLTRVAASHLRVGTFQYFAARGELERLRQLLDHAVARHDPVLAARHAEPADRAFGLLEAVARRQAALVAQWMNVGFIHGVMNTDNMTISGETIDYGPCAFMEAYDPQTVFSSIDHGGRYAYANQPLIARWNLARLAEALLPLTCDGDDEAAVKAAVERVTAVIDAFPTWHAEALRRGQRAKLGLAHARTDDDQRDAALADDWLGLLQAHQVDFTLGWRALARASEALEAGRDDEEAVDRATASLQPLFAASPEAPRPWLRRWQARCRDDDAARPSGQGAAAGERLRAIEAASPALIARNHRVEQALSAAMNEGDLAPFEALLAALQSPFSRAAEASPFAQRAPGEFSERYRTFCGT